MYLCLYVFAKRNKFTNIAYYFIVYSASISLYCFASAFGLMSTTLEQIKYWTIVQYVGMAPSAPLGLLFIMKYLGMNLTTKKWMALLTIPFLSFIMVATNDFHHLHYRVIEIDPLLGAPFIYQEIGIWYMIHGLFTFSSMFIALLFVVSRWKETAKVYRPQLLSLICGQLVPMVTAFLYLIGFAPPGVDPVPMVLWLTSLFYLWSITSSRMFSIMPIAKDAIFNSINDGVMVLDDANRLIEFNQASKSMFPLIGKAMFGMDLHKVWFKLTGETLPSDLANVGDNQTLQIMTRYSKRIYQVRTSSLHHVNNPKGRLLIFTDITELKTLQEKLENLAYYDDLTQIYNRRAFFQKCDQEFTAAKNEASPFSIILMDIDYFKKVNDTYGHLIGDQLLRHVVKVCQTQLQENMLFARYGGEEFVIALKGYSALEAKTVANQLRSHVEAQPLLTSEGVINITLSSGVAESTKETEETLQQLLNHADQALYTAKREGRNLVCVFA